MQLTTADAAARIGVAPRTLRKWVQRGRIRATYHGRMFLLNRDDVETVRQAYAVLRRAPNDRGSLAPAGKVTRG